MVYITHIFESVLYCPELWYFTAVDSSQRELGSLARPLTLMRAILKITRYTELRWGSVNPLGGNYWNNGVTYFPALVTVCFCVRALGGGALWQVGGSHLFPALQEISSRTFYPRVLELTSHKFNTALSTPAPLWFSAQYCLEQVTL